MYEGWCLEEHSASKNCPTSAITEGIKLYNNPASLLKQLCFAPHSQLATNAPTIKLSETDAKYTTWNDLSLCTIKPSQWSNNRSVWTSIVTLTLLCLLLVFRRTRCRQFSPRWSQRNWISTYRFRIEACQFCRCRIFRVFVQSGFGGEALYEQDSDAGNSPTESSAQLQLVAYKR